MASGNGLTTRVTLFWETIFAVIITLLGVATGLVLMVNVPEVSPAFTNTDDGSTIGAFEAANNCTDSPPAAAPLLNFTVPTTVSPAVTEYADKVNADNAEVGAGAGANLGEGVVDGSGVGSVKKYFTVPNSRGLGGTKGSKVSRGSDGWVGSVGALGSGG